MFDMFFGWIRKRARDGAKAAFLQGVTEGLGEAVAQLSGGQVMDVEFAALPAPEPEPEPEPTPAPKRGRRKATA